MNILITGGAGFVGSNIAVYLKNKFRDWNIIAFDNLKRRGSELNIPRLKENKIEFIHGDIRNIEDFFEFKKRKIDFLIECSAEPSVLAGQDGNSFYLVNTNLNGLINCLEICKESKSNIIFLSTSRVYPYDPINNIPVVEDDTRFKWEDKSFKGISENFTTKGAKTLYGATKLAGELFIEEYAKMFDFKYVINRFGVIAGPWQFGKVDQGVFSLWMLAHYFKKDLKYIGFGGKGKQVRDLLHVDDLCKLIEWEILNFDNINEEIFNAGGGNDISLSLLETTKLCEKITGNKINITANPLNRPGDIKIYITDNSYVTEKTNWKPEKSSEEILVDIFNWIKENEKFLKSR